MLRLQKPSESEGPLVYGMTWRRSTGVTGGLTRQYGTRFQTKATRIESTKQITQPARFRALASPAAGLGTRILCRIRRFCTGFFSAVSTTEAVVFVVVLSLRDDNKGQSQGEQGFRSASLFVDTVVRHDKRAIRRVPGPGTVLSWPWLVSEGTETGPITGTKPPIT